jgi:SAM-dependent methyltransferase
MSLSSYGMLATEVYDIDKPIGHSFGDVEFYLGRLRSCTGRVLEPAVGTGRMMIPLLEAGIKVEGVDNSPEMLAICRARCAERGLEPALYEGDLRHSPCQKGTKPSFPLARST